MASSPRRRRSSFGSKFNGFVASKAQRRLRNLVAAFALKVSCNLEPGLRSFNPRTDAGWAPERSGLVPIFFVLKALVAVFVVLLSAGYPVRAQEPTRRVLLLYPYDNVSPATLTAGTAIRKRLAEEPRLKIDILSDFLDLARFPGESDQLRSARYLAEKYAGNPPEVIMPLSPEAQRFATEYRDVIAPKVPIVFCCVTPELAGVADRPGRRVVFGWKEPVPADYQN